MSVRRVMGTEIEYGISVPGNPGANPMVTSSQVVNAYQGLLPTYLYAFQFPVSTAERNVATPLLSPTLAILTIAIGVTCLVVAYSASVWRLAIAESTAAASSGSGGSGGISPSSDGGGDVLARSGGGA